MKMVEIKNTLTEMSMPAFKYTQQKWRIGELQHRSTVITQSKMQAESRAGKIIQNRTMEAVRSVVTIGGWGGINRSKTGFSRQRLYDTSVMDKYRNTFVQPVSPNDLRWWCVNNEGCNSWNKCTTLVEEVDNGRGDACVCGGGIYRKLLYLPLNLKLP